METPYKHVAWECTTVCNYSCTYCKPYFHDGKYRWPSKDHTDNLISYLQDYSSGDPIILDIMGGEPTLWPGLRDFCKKVSNFCFVTFSTNGSRSLRYWEQFDVPLDHLLFSFHPETASTEHFLSVLEKIQNRMYITVQILYHPNYKDKCEHLFNMIDNRGFKVEVEYKFIELGPENILPKKMKKNITKQINRNECSKNTLQHTKWLVNGVSSDPRLFIKNQINQFQGYQCFVGEHYRYILANGDIYGAQCNVAPLLGNIYNTDEKKIPQPVICTRRDCYCLSDLVLNKKCYTQE